MDPPQDVQQMCKQAERDQESKKLTLLLERVKRQIAARQDPDRCSKELGRGVRLPSRSIPLEK
jgi:hypothetical protein